MPTLRNVAFSGRRKGDWLGESYESTVTLAPELPNPDFDDGMEPQTAFLLVCLMGPARVL